MEDNYVCKIASLDELIEKSDYEILIHPNNDMWVKFKELAIKNYNNKNRILYIGKLNNKIICEATAVINKDGLKGDINNSDELISDTMVYLSGFRTNKEFIGKGYFKKLFIFMENDLKNKGYNKMSLGVEPREVRNIQIYFKLGFVNYIKTTIEYLPSKNKDSKPIEEIVNFYYKDI